MATITKKELIDRIADNAAQRRVQVKRVVQQFLDEIVNELGKGNRLEFRDFGVFESKLRKARKAQNPKTLEPVAVPEKRTVKFKVGRLMKQKLGDLAGKVTALPQDGSVPTLPGWRWLHTPGHAAGHISLWREQDKLLLPGDAFCTTKQESFLAVAKQKRELHGPPAYYTPDWDAARASVDKLSKLCPRTIAPCHGLPMCGDEVADQLVRLAVNFDHVAMPDHGKYVHKTATT